MIQLSLPVSAPESAALAALPQPGTGAGEIGAGPGFAALLAGQPLAPGVAPGPAPAFVSAPAPVTGVVASADHALPRRASLPLALPVAAQPVPQLLPGAGPALPDSGKGLPVPQVLAAIKAVVAGTAQPARADVAADPVIALPLRLPAVLARIAAKGRAVAETEEASPEPLAKPEIRTTEAAHSDGSPPVTSLVPVNLAVPAVAASIDPAPPRTEQAPAPQQSAPPAAQLAASAAQPDKPAIARTARTLQSPADSAPRFVAAALAALAPVEPDLREPVAAIAAPILDIRPVASPRDIATAPAVQSAGPIDFAQLVDSIARARAEAQAATSAQPVHVALRHAEFGAVSLRFEHERGGDLTVAMTSPDPDFARAVAAVTAPERGQLSQDAAAPRGDAAARQPGGDASGGGLSGHAQSSPQRRNAGDAGALTGRPGRPAPGEDSTDNGIFA